MAFGKPWLAMLAIAAVPGVLIMVGDDALAAQDEVVRTREQVAEEARRVLDQYEDGRLAEMGVLDVTKRPYGADPSGERDSTRAVQRAVKDARDARLVCFFPVGRYLVSDTIVGIQGHVDPQGWGPRWRNDDYPCVLWGSTRGGRARIVLAPGAPGFGDPEHPKPVIFLSARRWGEPHDLQPNVSFNQMIVSLDVQIGPGNPGAIGIDHQAAQGSVTEDVTVDAGDGFAGLRGVPGSGGSASHVTVVGGRYGLCLTGLQDYLLKEGLAGSQPSPVVSHLTLRGQQELSILSTSRGPLTLVGAEVEGPGIRLEGRRWSPWNGALNVVDSVFRHEGGGPLIAANRPVYLSNVYVEGAEAVCALEGAPALAGNPAGWMHVAECAASPGPQYPIWEDGARRAEPVVAVDSDSGPPPADLQGRHDWPLRMPTWQDEGVANVRESPYGAKGDFATDDTDAIQRALNQNDAVFLPKGVYLISQPLRLRPGNRLFGLGVHSILHPAEGASAFGDPARPAPMVETPDDAAADVGVAFFQVWSRRPGAYALHWRAGGRSMVRNVRVKGWPWPRGGEPPDYPLVRVDGNGGGRWYNFFVHARMPEAPGYRHILVEGTRQPLTFYMLNPEHAGCDVQAEFRNVENVDVFAVKAETLGAGGRGPSPPLRFVNSRRFRVIGYGGNATPAEGRALVLIEKCSEFVLANFSTQQYGPGPPRQTWSVLEELTRRGELIRTPGTEWFALYKRR
jgi:hypothetical protein